MFTCPSYFKKCPAEFWIPHSKSNHPDLCTVLPQHLVQAILYQHYLETKHWKAWRNSTRCDLYDYPRKGVQAAQRACYGVRQIVSCWLCPFSIQAYAGPEREDLNPEISPCECPTLGTTSRASPEPPWHGWAENSPTAHACAARCCKCLQAVHPR